MGCVYLAEHLKLERLIALKVVAMGAAASPELLSRFREESKAVAAVTHPGVCQIYEVGESEGLPFLAMEYIQGETLADALRNQLPTIHDAVRCVLEISKAIEACHQAGILHRDLKPANVMLTQQKTIKVMDFGLAKRLEGGNQHQTQTGEIIGTPSYMAPEQASGVVKQFGPETDVYAIGAILYELLTGRPPFQTPDIMQTVMLVLTEEPINPRKLQPRIPADLETVCLKCLDKKPQKRYPSAELLAQDLRRFLENRPIAARPTPFWERCWKWIRRHPTYTALNVASILIITGAVIGTTFHVNRMKVELNRSGRLFDNSQEIGRWLVNEHIPNIARIRGGSTQQEELVSKTLEHLQELEQDIAADRSLAEYIAQAYQRIAEVQSDPFFATDFRIQQAIISHQSALRLYENLAFQNTTPDTTDIRPQIEILIHMARLRLQQQQIKEAADHLAEAHRLLESIHVTSGSAQVANLEVNELEIMLEHQQGTLSNRLAYDRYHELYQSGLNHLETVGDPPLEQLLGELSLLKAQMVAEASAEEFEDIRGLQIDFLLQAVDHFIPAAQNSRQSSWRLAKTRAELAKLLEQDGQFEQADRMLKDAIEQQQRLVNEIPESSNLNQSLLTFLEQQITTELSRPDLDAALESAIQHMEVAERLYLSETDVFRDDLLKSFELLAEVQRQRFRYEESSAAIQKAIELSRRESEDSQRLILARLLKSHANLIVERTQQRSTIPERLKALQQAIVELKESLQIYEEIGIATESDASSPYWKTLTRLHELESELEQVIIRSRERERILDSALQRKDNRPINKDE